MITHCEECDTYFRVSIDQLKAANGQVKCGCCMKVFNAIESLLENTEATSAQNFPTDPDQAGNNTIGSTILGTEVEVEEEPEQAFSEEIELSNEDDDLEFFEEKLPTGEANSSEEDDGAIVSEEIHNLSEQELSIFEGLIDDENAFSEPIEKKSNTIWVVTSIFFIGLLLFQLITFNPGAILAKFPKAQPMCHLIECPIVTKFNDTSAINLISRDVREHPQFRDVLLVNATLMNSSKDFQVFPKLQLDLFNKVGRPVGSRQFSPNEYLDESVDLETGMKPKQPVHIVLEILGSADETSSFEFTFL